MPRWLRILKTGADTVGVLLFLTAFSGFMIQVFYRYVLNHPLAWTEEYTMIAFMWTVFWSAAFMVGIREHVSFDVVYDVVSPSTQRVLAIVAMIFLVVAFVMLIPATWDYLTFMMRKKSPVLRVRMHWVYGCYILFLVNFSIQALWRLWILFGPRWRTQV
ncbi:TRAP transporter small permease [Consotaella aegiceratis]|uniref:TRAP transporter small permease n=1 Tax=Consotaella aegiceratis TaxID=3097961 RepID=UPI002F400421